MKMYELWCCGISFGIQVLGEGMGCAIFQILRVALIHFLFAMWLFRCHSVAYVVVVSSTKSLSSSIFIALLLFWSELCGAGVSRVSLLMKCFSC